MYSFILLTELVISPSEHLLKCSNEVDRIHELCLLICLVCHSCMKGSFPCSLTFAPKLLSLTPCSVTHTGNVQ